MNKSFVFLRDITRRRKCRGKRWISNAGTTVSYDFRHIIPCETDATRHRYVQYNSSTRRKHYSLFSLARSKRVDRDAAHDESERLSTNAGSASANGIASSTFPTSLQIAASRECMVILTVYTLDPGDLYHLYAKKRNIFLMSSNLRKRDL